MLRNTRRLGWDSRPPIRGRNILRLQLLEIHGSKFIRCCLIPQNPQEVQKTEVLLCSWECWRAGVCCGLEEGPWLLASYAGCSPQLRLLMFWLTKAPPPPPSRPFPSRQARRYPSCLFSSPFCANTAKNHCHFPFLFGGGWELVSSQSSYIQGQKWPNVPMLAHMFVHEQVMKAIDWKLLCSTRESKD